MSNIQEDLAKILSSRYGRDVRQSIHDAIEDCYEDGRASAIATTETTGLVKPDGATITIDSDGTIHSIGGGGGGGTTNYNLLSNKPKINNKELTGNVTLSEIGAQPSGTYITPSDVATANNAGLVKPDGTTITVSANGTISSISGGTSDYSDLSNKPQINSIELSGNKSLSDLGIQPSGNYLTENSVATTNTKGIVKPDGTTITVDANGTISAIGGGGGGTSDYSALSNKPKINNVELSGNKTLAEIGIQTATTSNTGLVKPDGTTITIDSNGKISAVGGGGGGEVPDNVALLGDTLSTEESEPRDADTLEGHSADYFATNTAINTLNENLSALTTTVSNLIKKEDLTVTFSSGVTENVSSLADKTIICAEMLGNGLEIIPIVSGSAKTGYRFVALNSSNTKDSISGSRTIAIVYI